MQHARTTVGLHMAYEQVHLITFHVTHTSYFVTPRAQLIITPTGKSMRKPLELKATSSTHANDRRKEYLV